MQSKSDKILWVIFVLATAIAFGQVGQAHADLNAQTLPFTQDWNDTALITTSDDWSGVPGITGYLGQEIATTTGKDPQTLLTESTLTNDLTVLANQTSANNTSGDVAEFELTDPTIALQGSSTADVPYILISVSTAGFKDIHISYNLRDVDGSADNATQPVALQYRLGSTGLFTNVAEGFVADATSGPSEATLVTPVNVILPAEANDQGLIQIRIITANATGSDEWVGIDDISITGTSTGVDTAPDVVNITPADSSINVARTSNITVTFSEAVDVSGEWFAIQCSVSGSRIVTDTVVTGGPASFIIDPNSNFANAETCTFSIFASQVTDQDSNDPPDAMDTDRHATFDIFNDVCSLSFTPIYNIQGNGQTAAITGTVTTQGVVVGDYELPAGSGQMEGFYIQDASGDGNPATADAIFVYTAGTDAVSLGDIVRVSGTAGEFQSQTQISSPTSITHCGDGTVAPVDVTIPWSSADQPERYEGMLVRVPQTLYVTEHFQLGRFGQIVVSSNARLYQPTQLVAPGLAAQTLQAQNDLNRLILDDGSNTENPDPILFGRGGLPLSASNTLRASDSVTGVIGVLTYTWGGDADSPNAYRVRPVNALGGGVPKFTAVNARPVAPTNVGGSIKVVSMNLLNYFNTFSGCTNGLLGSSTTCRGANNATEFTRQSDKIVNAIVTMNADVYGVVELENDGYGASSAIQDLVNKLNSATAPGTYTFINADTATGLTDALGSDAIKVCILYKPAKVTPVGTTAILNTTAFINGGDTTARNRISLLQAFQTVATRETFLVNVNHLKSKSSACDTPDTGDGQGECALVRANAAAALINWLASDPTGTSDPDVILLGDLNSYAKEDPLADLGSAGYANMVSLFNNSLAYSYAFNGQWGTLDYILASASLLGQITGAAEFHINADEPSILDYNTEYKSASQVTDLYNSNPFRASDHDPILVGLELDATAPIVTVPANMTVEAVNASGAVVTFSASASDNLAGSLTPTCIPASGTRFPLGTTQVTCSATDSFNNTGYGRFTVTVRDTTPPTLTLPADMTAHSLNPGGIPVTFSVSATDTVGPANPLVTCSPSSGATFEIGTTTVVCSASDSYNNRASDSFTITVQLVTNLLAKPGFGGPYFFTYPWIPFGMSKPIVSALDCNTFNSARCSLRLRGTSSTTTQMALQYFHYAGTAGDEYAFGVFNRMQNVPDTGINKVELLFFDNYKHLVGIETLNFNPGTHDFELVAGTAVAPQDYARILFRLTFRNQRGSAWFDDAFLYLIP